MWLAALWLACARPDAVGAAAGCGDGEIRLLPDGELAPDLGWAYRFARPGDTICVGPGEYTLDDMPGRDEPGVDGDLAIVGAGSDVTRLVGADDDTDDAEDGDAWLEVAGALRLEGLTVEDAALSATTGAVTVRDVVVTGHPGATTALRLVGADVIVRDTAIRDARLEDGGGLVVLGDAVAFADVAIERTTTSTGHVAYVNARLTTWIGGTIAENVRTVDDPGFDLVEIEGAAVLDSVRFADNVSNGPLLASYAGLDAALLEVTGNRAGDSGVLFARGPTRIAGGRFAANTAPWGALALTEAAHVELTDVDFGTGTEANAPCDVTFDGACVGVALGDSASASCGESGCVD